MLNNHCSNECIGRSNSLLVDANIFIYFMQILGLPQPTQNTLAPNLSKRQVNLICFFSFDYVPSKAANYFVILLMPCSLQLVLFGKTRDFCHIGEQNISDTISGLSKLMHHLLQHHLSFSRS